MPNTPSPTLNIAVVGAGQIGSAMAYHLARFGGQQVTMVARPDSNRLRQLERDGAIVALDGERAAVSVTHALDEDTTYDLVIVTLLAHQLDSVLPALQRSAARSILFIGNTFEPERLQATVGIERCTLGMPFLQASLNQEGRLKVVINARGPKTILDDPIWVNLFNGVGLPTAVEPQMPLWLRCHVPLCIAFESVSVAGMKRGGGASWREAWLLARGVHACFRLIESLGYPLYPKTKSRIARSPKVAVAAVLWSMSRVRSFRELLATGRAECIALVNDVAAVAPRANAPVNVADILAMKP